MRKMLAITLATGLGLSVIQPSVLAEDDVEVEETEEEAVEETKEVNSLSIDAVVERGLKRNSVLLLLDYQMEILENQKSQTELDRDDTKSDLNEAIDKRRELREQRDELDDMVSGLKGDIRALSSEIAKIQSQLEDPETDEELIEELTEVLNGYLADLESIGKALGEGEQAKESLEQAIEGIVTQIEALEDAIVQLDLAIKKLAIGEITLEVETEETGILMETMLKSNYIQLLSMKEQLAFQKQMMQQVEQEINLTKRRVELGLESPFELEKVQRTLEDQEEDITQSEKDFQRQLAKLALDLGIIYREDIELLSIDLEELMPVQRQDEKLLISKSYALKKSDQDLEIARLELEYAESEGTEYQIKIAELEQKVVEENRRKLIVDSQKYIDDLYFDAEKAYKEIETKERDLGYAESDYKKIQRQHELGLLSDYQAEQAEVQVKQAEFELHMAKISYYMLLEQVDNMHAGVLQ